MNRKEREITNFEEIFKVLEKCNTIHVAFRGDEYPYVVPLSFGIIREGNDISLYFHGPKKGLKIELLEKCPLVCVAADIFHKVEETAHGITTRYESIIGFGRIEKVEGAEIVEGLRAICVHYGRPEYPIGRCKGLPATAVYKIKIESLTGKHNLPA